MKGSRWGHSLEVERAKLRGFARSIAQVEWLLLLLVVLYLAVVRPPLASPAIVTGGLVAFAVAVLMLRYLPQLRAMTLLKVTLEILVMFVFLTLVLSQAGGETSPLVNLYLLPIIAAALTLGRAATTLVMVLVWACYFFLATEAGGLEALTPSLLTQAGSVLGPFLLVAFLTTLLVEHIETASRRIRALSDRDELTNLLNLQAFMRIAEREHSRSVDNNGTYSILVADIDRLKKINDTYGHEAGDNAVRTVAEALLRVTRSADLIARTGGDQFAACLADADLVLAAEVAQRLRNVVYASTFEVNAGIVRVQVSVGVANFPVDGGTVGEVLAVAERAMYEERELRAPPEGRLVIQKR